MTETKDFVTVAKIAGPFGLKGEVRVKTNAPFFIEHILEAKQFYIAGGKKTLTPTDVRELKDGFAFSFKEVPDRTAAERLPRDFLLLSRDTFPLSEGLEIVFEDDILNFDVLHAGKRIGSVTGFHDYGAAPVIEVTREDQNEGMFPLIEENIEAIDPETRVIEITEAAMSCLRQYEK